LLRAPRAVGHRLSRPDEERHPGLEEEAPEQREDEPSGAALEAYLDWHEAREIVQDVYRAYRCTRAGEARLAFGAYVAALDAEEWAAQRYRRMVRASTETRT
jgi:hypothetical protein